MNAPLRDERAALPSVDRVLRAAGAADLVERYGRQLMTEAAREAIDVLNASREREGEAIAWHLLETWKPRVPVKRRVFHESTEPAIRAAADDPRPAREDVPHGDAGHLRRKA